MRWEPGDLQRFAAEERSLPATPRRRARARREGWTARTVHLPGGLALLAAAAAWAATVGAAADRLLGWSASVWSAAPAGPLTVGTAASLLGQAGVAAAGAVLPVGAAALAAAVLAHVAQGGGRPSGVGLARLNPWQGLQRLVSLRGLEELLRAAVAAAAILALSVGPVRGLAEALAAGRLDLPQEIVLVDHALLTLLARAAVAELGVAAADYAYRRWELERRLRMTPRELREELRETEGDPALRLRRRRRMRELARRRMLGSVRQADVVVANPTHVAVALRYRPGRDAAPVVVAKGAELLAERIREIARLAGVPVVENPPLARSLYALVPLGRPIPPALYQAVAEVLAFVWRAGRRAPPGLWAAVGTRGARRIREG